MKRLFDLFLSITLLILLCPLIVFCFLLVKFTSKGPALYWSKRVGINNCIFLMPKFRSMKIHTPQLATHLLTDSDNFLTPVGSFIRKTSLDELPQLWSVLSGDMSFVGPRPALFNQDDLIKLRTEAGVHTLKPGITGYAQINGRDSISIDEKAKLDSFYLENNGILFDFKIILSTAFAVLKKNNISH
ncbi:sugar transferase [Halobacteriovorax sp. JY17]|uniref:sugar transferase n=1 Tax=Halobacteriovorax sp. JY17 TaxID=2014617 RepID=UPI000C578D25|nr:sugar transferase [Halobacteriovorax sp. JY17]PIK14666.1 MAG: lipid carrier--UDP-N-acetylgalactosaminyltransferase [Halobacteriovorax sp. JY17]